MGKKKTRSSKGFALVRGRTLIFFMLEGCIITPKVCISTPEVGISGQSGRFWGLWRGSAVVEMAGYKAVCGEVLGRLGNLDTAIPGGGIEPEIKISQNHLCCVISWMGVDIDGKNCLGKESS